jgi:hypothetical protein
MSKMRIVRKLAAALAALALTVGSASAQDNAPASGEIVVAQAKRAPATRHTGTHVYLLRGFMDIFSTGMDDLGVKMNRQGIQASVHNHGEFPTIADTIIDRHRRGIRENVVIIGHSLGGNDAFRMAEVLGSVGITVPLIISYDPTASMSVPRNVSRVVNFYSSTNGWGAPIVPGPGFRGSLSNVDLSRRGEIGHTDIDKSPSLHSQSINYVQSIGGRRSRSQTASPKDSSSGKESKATTAPREAEKATADSSPEATASLAAKKEAAPSGAAPKPAEAKSGSNSEAKPSPAKTETAASPAPGAAN